MFDMTPELQAELIKYFLISLASLGTIIMATYWALYRWFNTRMEQNKKDRETERETERKRQQAAIDAQEREWKLRYEEIKGDQKDKHELFELNRKQAENGEMVAKALERLVSAEQDTSSQIEIFSSQLKNVGTSNNELIQVVNTASEKVDSLIENITAFLKDLQHRDQTTKESRQAILIAVQTIQKDMAILQPLKTELEAIKRKVSHLADTQPIPDLPTNGNPADDTDNENQPKEDIA